MASSGLAVIDCIDRAILGNVWRGAVRNYDLIDLHARVVGLAQIDRIVAVVTSHVLDGGDPIFGRDADPLRWMLVALHHQNVLRHKLPHARSILSPIPAST